MEDALAKCSYKTCQPFIPKFSEGKIVKCYDGDTVTIATIMNDEIVRFSVRMLGYDCAEIRSKNEQEKQVAKWAKDYITNMIMDKMVKIVKNEGYDKYGRLLLELQIDDTNVNEVMLKKWGVKYYGGHKEAVDWSKWSKDGLERIKYTLFCIDVYFIYKCLCFKNTNAASCNILHTCNKKVTKKYL